MTPNTKLKVLWIGRHESSERSGEVVFDRKIARILRDEAEVSFFEPPRLGRGQELLNLAAGHAWYRARYRSADTLAKARALAEKADVVVCSWEPYDFLAQSLGRSCVLILHNITRDSLGEMFPGSLPARLLAARAGSHEKRCYRAPEVKAILTLSKRDKALVEALKPDAPVFWTPPGAPPVVPLASDAVLDPLLCLSGSYDWSVKKRDLGRFLEEVQGRDWIVASDDALPQDLVGDRKIAAARFEEDAYCAAHLRFGIIPDRFVAGHKLKAMFYVARNAMVLSYADIGEEFEGIVDADLFVRQIRGAEDIAAIMTGAQAMPAGELCSRFAAFKEACLARFSWDRAGRILADATTEAAAGQGEALSGAA